MWFLSVKKIFSREERRIIGGKKRTEQDSNLRGQSPLDFESNALTTRPSVPGWPGCP